MCVPYLHLFVCLSCTCAIEVGSICDHLCLSVCPCCHHQKFCDGYKWHFQKAWPWSLDTVNLRPIYHPHLQPTQIHKKIFILVAQNHLTISCYEIFLRYDPYSFGTRVWLCREPTSAKDSAHRSVLQTPVVDVPSQCPCVRTQYIVYVPLPGVNVKERCKQCVCSILLDVIRLERGQAKEIFVFQCLFRSE